MTLRAYVDPQGGKVSNNHNAYERRRANNKPTPMSFAGLSLPADESEGQCDGCGKDGMIFTETKRCKDCEIREVARYLMGEFRP